MTDQVKPENLKSLLIIDKEFVFCSYKFIIGLNQLFYN